MSDTQDQPPEKKPTSPWGDAPQNEPVKPAQPQSTGGNPFGHGPKKPAGTGGGNNNGQPDLDELVRRSRERLKGMIPPNLKDNLGNGFAGGDPDGLKATGITIAIVAIAILWLATGFYRVQEGQLGVVLRFGEVNRTAQPGLRYHLPYPFETALTPNVTFENRIEIGFRSQSGTTSTNTGDEDALSDKNVPEESAMLTADQNIIDLDFAVTWVVKDPSLFLFEIRDPETTVKRAAESAMREVIGQTEIQDALTGARDQIQQDTRALLQQILDGYNSGVEIVRVELLRVNPPAPVVDAFNDVQRAEADRERLRNEAESYRNKIIPEARGEAEKIRNEADGYRQQVINEATGEASRFTQVLAAYDSAREITMQRLYLETMEQVLKGSTKVILEGNRTVPYLPLGQYLPSKSALPAPVNNTSSAPAVGPRILGPALSPSAFSNPDSVGGTR